MTQRPNLLGPEPTLLPQDPAAASLASGTPVVEVARAYPASMLAWATLAEAALDGGRPIEAYAFARTGYHRGLDALRKAGWRGQGEVPWSHEPNRGFLCAVAALAYAAREIGEEEEALRCAQLVVDSSPEGARALGFMPPLEGEGEQAPGSAHAVPGIDPDADPDIDGQIRALLGDDAKDL